MRLPAWLAAWVATGLPAACGCSDAPSGAEGTAVELRAMREEIAALRVELEATRAALQALEARVGTPGTPPPPEPPPRPDPAGPKGRVLAADSKMGVYLLSLGEKDGLKVGDDLLVFRGDQFVAQVVVDRVLDDKSAALDKKDPSGKPIRSGEIRQGDRVARLE